MEGVLLPRLLSKSSSHISSVILSGKSIISGYRYSCEESTLDGSLTFRCFNEQLCKLAKDLGIPLRHLIDYSVVS